jgi:nitrogen regulatory protein PII
MKRVDAVIRPGKLSKVRELLSSIGIREVFVTEIVAFGQQMNRTTLYGDRKYSVDFSPMVQLTVVTSEERVPQIVDKIIEGGRSEEVGDGIIIIASVADVIQIKNGEHEEAASFKEPLLKFSACIEIG